MEIIHTPITDFLIRKSRIFGGFLARNIQEFGGFLIRIMTDILIRNIEHSDKKYWKYWTILIWVGGFLIRILTDILIRNIRHSEKILEILDTLAYYDSTDTFNSCDACEYLAQNITVTIAWNDSDKNTFASDDC